MKEIKYSKIKKCILDYTRNKKSNFIKSLKELENYFKKYGKWIGGIILILYTFLLIKFLIDQSKGSLQLLGFNLKGIFILFIILLFVFIVLYWSRNFLLKYVKKNGNFHNILAKFNIYIFLTFFIISLISIIGMQYLGSIFQPQLPKPYEFSHYKNNDYYSSIINSSIKNISNFVCNGPHDYFVIGDTIQCDFNITYLKNPSYYLSGIFIGKWHLLNMTYEQIDYNEYYPEDNLLAYIGIPIIAEGNQNYLIRLDFEKKEGNVVQTINSVYYAYLNFDVQTVSDYNEIPGKKITYLIALISLVSFTVVSTIRNLRDMMEQK